MRKNKVIKENAITLVALVITVIILIILAGVSLNLALGQNGIFVKSKEAVNKYKDSAQKEQNEMDNLYNTLKTLDGNGDDDQMLGDDPTTTITGGNYDESKGVNTPAIKSGEGFTMELVKYEAKENGTEGTWVPDTDGTSWSYNDGEGDHKTSYWANAKVTIDNVDSYFVWIPRFAYKITYYKDANKTPVGETDTTPTKYGKIDVVFLQGTTDTYIDEQGQKQTAKRATADSVDSTTDYIVHPAFTTDAGTGGGWKEELPGLWIGKYETSLYDKQTKQYVNIDNENYETEGDILLSDHPEKAIAVQPNMSSWRYCTIGKMYTNAKEYLTNLNSHMLKNSEWGAVVYLTHSKYGRNGNEISINNDSNFTTSVGGDLASTTGNVYGIYDLRGGAYEYVAAYYNDSEKLSTYGSTFANTSGRSNEYATVYEKDVNEEANAYKKGDATYETSGWNSNKAYFVDSDDPFFLRGGYFSERYSISGMFDYLSDSGNVNKYNSFRLSLAVL